MAKGFILADYRSVTGWSAVTVEQVSPSQNYNNADSKAIKVLNISPLEQWGSPLVTPGAATQQFQFKFARSVAIAADTVAVIGLQVLGELEEREAGGGRGRAGVVGRPEYRHRLDSKPTVSTQPQNQALPADRTAAEMVLNPYSVPQFLDDNDKSQTLAWYGSQVRTFSQFNAGNDFTYRFLIDAKNQKHSVRIDRMMIGQRWNFPRNMRPEWTISESNYSSFERTPGQFSNEIIRRPSYRTANVNFQPIEKAQMDMFDELKAACDSFVPMLWCFDPDDPTTWIYGIITPGSYNKTFYLQNKAWGLRLTVEELHH